jgi:arylsulfatase
VGGEELVALPPGASDDDAPGLAPRRRGFDSFYGITDGAAHFYHPHSLMRDDKVLPPPGEGYYFTDAITDEAIGMIETSAADETPFFLYLAHTAPHWPLHAPPEDIARYEGVYTKGWDAVRTARHEEMSSRGVLEHPWAISPRDEAAPAWNDAKHPDWEAARMAAYAAMVDRMDQSIGRLVAALKRLGQLEDTLIMFLSDNGGCAEFLAEDVFSHLPEPILENGEKVLIGNRPGLRPGGPLTYQSYDLPWANVSNAPFRLFKHWVHEGGISTPLVVQWPARLKRPHVSHAASHVVDILPTILEAAGVRYPSEIGGRVIQPLDGESLLDLMAGKTWSREQPIFWEHEGNAAVRLGELKLVRRFGEPWELYDMTADRTELHDLSGRSPGRARDMIVDYDAWAGRVGVMDWNDARGELRRIWRERMAKG